TVAAKARAEGKSERAARLRPASGGPEQVSRDDASDRNAARAGERAIPPEKVRPDVLVTSDRPLATSTIERLRNVRGVAAATAFGMSSTAIEGHTVTVAAVDP